MAASKPTATDEQADDSRSLVQLIRELPGLALDLLRAEFERFKREMSRKAKNIGAGTLFFLAASGTALFLMGALILAAVYALAMVMPTWAAALVVSAGLLVTTIVLVVAGIAQFKKSQAMMPTETMDSIVEDAHALKGEGRYDS
jgi:hypothetical protein